VLREDAIGLGVAKDRLHILEQHDPGILVLWGLVGEALDGIGEMSWPRPTDNRSNRAQWTPVIGRTVV